MPRNITVTFADGSQHVYANAPDDITPDAVTARAQKDFGQPVKSLDGGRNATSAAPQAPTIPANPKNGFGLGAPPGPKGTPERAAYDAEYNKRFNAAWLNANPRQAQLRRARSDPAFAARLAAAEAQRKATNASQQGDLNAFDAAGSAQDGGFGTGYLGGFVRGTFGLGERLAAAGASYLPTWLGGVDNNASYDQNLAKIRANTDAQMARSPTGAILGQLTSGTAVTAGAGAGIGAGASRLAASSAPVAARAGNVLQALTTLRKGQKLANAGKLVLSGAAAGGAQAAGEGSDPIKGAAYGAAGSAALGGGFKAAQVLTRPFRDVIRLSSAGQILSRLTSATTDQLAERATAYRAATGAEPTLFELLPLADRNKILKQAIVGRDNVVEATSNAIRARANNLGPEMSARANEVLAPQRQNITTGIANDLTTARGGVSAPEDPALVAGAASNPTDMVALRRQEANAIMAPHENTPIVGNLEELYPSVPGPSGQRVVVDPEVARVISSAAGTLRARPENAGITAGDITDMMSTLGGDLAKGGIEGRTAQRAISHLQDTLDTINPEAGAASRQMTDAYAARSRMMEGMKEGAATRLRNDIQVGTSNREARRVTNAYDTPEGTQGRTLGQGNQILSSLGGSPEDALRATIGMSRGGTGRQLAQNIGPDEAQNLITAARAQDDSAQAIAAASQKVGGNGGEGADAETLVSALAGLHPSSFITTKAGALRKLVDMTYIPENRARTIVDMIFSQNPAMVRRALNAVGNEENGAAFKQYLAGITGATSASPANPTVDLSAEPETSAETTAEPGEEAPVYMADPNPEGLVEAGNIDLNSRVPVDNGDGTYSTVRSISIGTDKGEVLIPTVVDGRVVSDAEAIAHYKATGEHLGIFKDAASADAYAEKLHNQQAGAYGQSAPGQPVAEADSPYAANLQQIYDTESPEMLDLISRVSGQESRGNQFDASGQPLTSSAGAIGAMQVMPATAPEAARLAGVPFDDNAYRNDPAYNKLIGIAYLSELLRKYDGDVARAVAAYNAGPGRVDAASSGGGDWISKLPAETQDYIRKVA